MLSNARVLRCWIAAMERARAAEAEASLPARVAAHASAHGADVALLDAGGAMTYAALARRAEGVARWAVARGLGAGDVVGVLMPNCAEYVAIWMGLTRVRCVAALLDTSLSGEAMAHALSVTGAGPVVAAAGLRDRLPPGTDVIDPASCHDEAAAIPPAREARATDVALLIGTSGTTGLPKAARLRHARVLEWSAWFAGMMEATPADRLYDCLPMYHSTGGVVAIGAMLFAGGSAAIGTRFSARGFWDDVARWDCTIFQYIGEVGRYLVASPPHPLERAHRLRLACGNGLQAGPWEAMQARFAIPEVLEFYAATEGSLSLYNREGRPGAVGRVPPFLAHRFPVALIRLDPDSAAPLRDADGRCLPCAVDEPGEALGPARFDGYTDPDATAAKLLHDVLAPGDAWFRTGDLLRRDAGGFYCFVDRLGDTFRWKGENVSTAQVAGVVASCPGVLDAVVYGVLVPGAEGRAGMAAVAVGEGFSVAGLHAHVHARLPPHACPLYLRIVPTVERTGTFKLRKAELARDGMTADTVALAP